MRHLTIYNTIDGKAFLPKQKIDSIFKSNSVRDLKKWRYLMETGAISAEEFEKKKKELLG